MILGATGVIQKVSDAARLKQELSHIFFDGHAASEKGTLKAQDHFSMRSFT
jgi:hypothetical protein